MARRSSTLIHLRENIVGWEGGSPIQSRVVGLGNTSDVIYEESVLDKFVSFSRRH